MNKKISPTLIGAFVVGAVFLIAAAVVIFGSGRLFRHRKEFVLYFDTSVNGLRIGAPVKFKGVEIGAVRNILLQVEPNMEILRIPVIIEVELEKLTRRGATGAVLEDEAAFNAAIKQGLRGQLLMESIVTGVLYVGLDVFPGTPANFVQRPDDEHQYQYPEIPTIPTALEKAQDAITQVLAMLQQTDIKGLFDSADQAFKGINQTVNSPEIRGAIKSLQQIMPKLDEAIVNVRNLAAELNSNQKILTTDLQQTSAEARAALKQAGETFKQAETAVANIEAVADPDSPTFYELNRSLREVSAAARSLRLLTDYLERNPRAIIFGKPEPKEE